MTALTAVVIAFPFSASGQAAGMAIGQSAGQTAGGVAGPPAEASGHSAAIESADKLQTRFNQRHVLRTCLAHDICPDAGEGIDRRILFTIRGWDGASARIFFGAVDASAYPVFAAAPITLWSAVLADELPLEDAVAGTAALVGGFGTTMALKRLVGRSRPYASIPGFRPRSGHAGARGLSESASFPSGHATLAAAIATGAAFLINHPAAAAASGAWAVSVSVSRLWLGVHYPTDVAAGLLVGTGTTILAMSVLR